MQVTITASLLRVLDPSFRVELPALRRRSAREPGRVLHVLTNHLPQTRSGYTLRSNAILRAQAELGWQVEAATRIGYPVTVGHLGNPEVQYVDGIAVHRLIPWVMPAEEDERLAAYARLLDRVAEHRRPSILQTLQPLIGVPIDHVAKVDFDGFKNMTDALGGVSINTDEGQQTMNGTDALKCVRERKSLSQGDISRGQRQMQFIRAVLMKGLSKETLSNPAEVARFLDAGTQNMVVDDALTTNKMQSIALSMRNVGSNSIKMNTAPWTGVDTGPYGMSIVNMSEPQMKVLAEHLSNDTMGSYVDNVSPKSGFGG